MAIETWDIDSTHSTLSFAIRHLMISEVHGRFTRWRGSIAFDEHDVGRSFVEIHVEAASIETDVPERDEHLRSVDFFDVEHHPELVFKSRRIERSDDERYAMIGDLTIRDTTSAVVFDVEYVGRTKDAMGRERAGFRASLSIDRRLFGVEWNRDVLETGAHLLGDAVRIEAEIEAVRKLATDEAA
jgi:polyisoprenoid-binding protein YceI